MSDNVLTTEQQQKKRPASTRQWWAYYRPEHKGTRWVTFNAEALLPRKPACYAIYLDGVLAYIGQARDLAVRMSSHGIKPGVGGWTQTRWGAHRHVKVKVRFADRLGDWAMREVRLIDRLRPPLNCVGVRQRARASA